MARIAPKPWPGCRGRSRCLWWRASTPRFRCTAAFWKTRNSATETLTPSLWSASLSGRSFAASKLSPTCRLPRLYPILDAGLLLQSGVSIEGFARDLREAGIRFLQYRDKDASDEVVLERAALLRSIFPASDSYLILNDRVSRVRAAGFDGVHVVQEDLSPAEVRASLGPEVLIGVSTHSKEQ